MYVNSIRIRGYKASMYSRAKACRFVKFGLTQKGGTMGQKKSKSHNPQSASITFSSTLEDPLNSFTYK